MKCDAQWLEYGVGDISNHLIKNKNSYYVEVLDIKASAGAGYPNSDVMEVIKLIEYDSEQTKYYLKV